MDRDREPLWNKMMMMMKNQEIKKREIVLVIIALGRLKNDQLKYVRRECFYL